MSTQTDFYSVDETPVEGDPTNEEMMPVEERMIQNLWRLRRIAHLFPDVLKEGMDLFIEIEGYFQNAVASRDGGCRGCGMHWEACCCPVVDPFEKEGA